MSGFSQLEGWGLLDAWALGRFGSARVNGLEAIWSVF